MPETIDIVLPVHNEADSIAHTLNEFYQVVAIQEHIPIRFVVSEDGSRDNSVGVLENLGTTLPIRLISAPIRKGYSRAVVDGLRATTASLVGFIDSDGQCDPKDFSALVAAMRSENWDMIFGYRNPRCDPLIRLLMSASFRFVYRCFFNVGVRDPSCPFLLIRRVALERVLDGNAGILKEGFWWEFNARCAARCLRIKEIPVNHRQRTAGVTQVYRLGQILRIAREHLYGLFRLKNELSRLRE